MKTRGQRLGGIAKLGTSALALAIVGCTGSSSTLSQPPSPSTAAATGGVPSAVAPATDGFSGATATAGTVSRPPAAGTSSAGATGSLTAGSAADSGRAAAGRAGTSAVSGSAGAGELAAGAPAAIGGGIGLVSGTGGSSGEFAGAGASGNAAGASAGMSADDQTLIPHKSWDCGLPSGIPGTTGATLVFEADLDVKVVHDIGETQYGHRRQLDISGGKLMGPNIQATFLDRGLDYELTLSNGAVEVEQINILRTTDGAHIYFRNCGTAPGPGTPVRVVADFEAPNNSPYAFLNTGKFFGTRELGAGEKTLKLKLYELPATIDGTGAISVVEPDGVPDQSWECKKASGTGGAVVYTESVGIGDGSVSVGASKRGTRNIIPITGGTTMGRIKGNVLSGGADFQLLDSSFELDARYTLSTDDGELIIVRNCGPLGALVPVFEASATGKYAWLNENKWLSSDPSIGIGVVNLMILEQR